MRDQASAVPATVDLDYAPCWRAARRPTGSRSGPGTFRFSRAGQPHHFEEFSDDLAVSVLDPGPEGGELGRGQRLPAAAMNGLWQWTTRAAEARAERR